MGLYRVNASFAPAGGSRLTFDEVVDIADEDLDPYRPFLGRYLVPYEPNGYRAAAAASSAPVIPGGDGHEAETEVTDDLVTASPLDVYGTAEPSGAMIARHEDE
jgi:hypothetical protein